MTISVQINATVWNEQAQLVADISLDGTGDNDEFGSAVAMDANIIVVGAKANDPVAANSGAAYVYLVNEATGLTTEIAQLVVSNGTSSDLLGSSVAIDGDVIVVGAYQAYSNDQGRAYIFEKPESGWAGVLNESAILQASNRGSNDEFGFSVDIDFETIVVGARGEDEASGAAGALYVFEQPNDGWSGVLEEDAKLIPSVSQGNNGYLGRSVSIEGDVIVSAAYLATVNGNDDQGHGYVFVKPQAGWSGTLTESAELLASDGQQFDKLGISVDMDNGTIVLGAYLAEPPGSNSNQGAAYVYTQPNGGWSGTIFESAILVSSKPGNNEELGFAVSMHKNTIAVGTGGYDRTYIFTEPDTGWTDTITETNLIQEDASGDNDFGKSVAVYNNRVVVTALLDDDLHTNAGKAYVYIDEIFKNGLE